MIITALSFALIAYLVGNSFFANYLQIHYVPGTGELAVICGALVGAGLGFLWYNAPPASVFMGDTGSLALGGALGAISVATRHELVLAVIGGLFVLETVSVIVQVVSFKSTGQARFCHGPPAPSLRKEGLGRKHHRYPFLDHLRHSGPDRAGHAEAEVGHDYSFRHAVINSRHSRLGRSGLASAAALAAGVRKSMPMMILPARPARRGSRDAWQDWPGTGSMHW